MSNNLTQTIQEQFNNHIIIMSHIRAYHHTKYLSLKKDMFGAVFHEEVIKVVRLTYSHKSVHHLFNPGHLSHG